MGFKGVRLEDRGKSGIGFSYSFIISYFTGMRGWDPEFNLFYQILHLLEQIHKSHRNS